MQQETRAGNLTSCCRLHTDHNTGGPPSSALITVAAWRAGDLSTSVSSITDLRRSSLWSFLRASSTVDASCAMTSASCHGSAKRVRLSPKASSATRMLASPISHICLGTLCYATAAVPLQVKPAILLPVRANRDRMQCCIKLCRPQQGGYHFIVQHLMPNCATITTWSCSQGRWLLQVLLYTPPVCSARRTLPHLGADHSSHGVRRECRPDLACVHTILPLNGEHRHARSIGLTKENALSAGASR